MIFNLLVPILLLLTFVLQEFIPAVSIAENARLFLPPVFFFAASVAVPFPAMLMLAFLTGLLWDGRYLPVASGGGAPMTGAELEAAAANALDTISTSDLRMGGSILVFGLLGALMQGVRPFFKRGRVELPVLMVGFATSFWLLMQYLLLSFLRESFHFTTDIWVKLVTDTLLAMLVAPLIFLTLHLLARMTSYEIKYEGLRYRYHGG